LTHSFSGAFVFDPACAGDTRPMSDWRQASTHATDFHEFRSQRPHPDSLVVCKPGAWHPVPPSTIEALKRFCFSGQWPKIQATCYAGGR